MFASLVKLHLGAAVITIRYRVYISRIILLFGDFIRFAITNVFRSNIINWLDIICAKDGGKWPEEGVVRDPTPFFG